MKWETGKGSLERVLDFDRSGLAELHLYFLPHPSTFRLQYEHRKIWDWISSGKGEKRYMFSADSGSGAAGMAVSFFSGCPSSFLARTGTARVRVS